MLIGDLNNDKNTEGKFGDWEKGLSLTCTTHLAFY
jgi:hypothetical protein